MTGVMRCSNEGHCSLGEPRGATTTDTLALTLFKTDPALLASTRPGLIGLSLIMSPLHLVFLVVGCNYLALGVNLPHPMKTGHVIHKRSPARQPRDVPVSSYTRFGGSEDMIPINQTPDSKATGASMVKGQEYSKYDGSFGFGHNLPNGISFETKGSQKTVGKDQGQVMEGQYSYTSPEGVLIVTKWFADETGFHVQGPGISVPVFRLGRK